jgi:hypothetical protein
LHPLFLFLDEKKKFAKRKIKAAAERAKTPAFRLNGNELAALKQISVLIACSPAFLNARPTEALPFLLPLRNAPRCSFSFFFYIMYTILYYTIYNVGYTIYAIYILFCLT